MLEIEKKKNMHNYDIFDINTDTGTFEIAYENNLDLYWRYIYKDTIDKVGNKKEFKITKEHYFLYNLFDELYNSVKNHTPYSNFPYEIESRYEKKRLYGNYPLYQNGEIKWYSDDFASFDNASSFSIKKEKDTFIVTFTKSKTEHFNGCHFPTYSVRIRNSGSRFEPFNIPFMSMYHKLKEYNDEYHQIHIEEYLYSKKRVKRK